MIEDPSRNRLASMANLFREESRQIYIKDAEYDESKEKDSDFPDFYFSSYGHFYGHFCTENCQFSIGKLNFIRFSKLRTFNENRNKTEGERGLHVLTWDRAILSFPIIDIFQKYR